MGQRVRNAVVPLVLSIDQAADALAISRDSFERHVMADLRLVRIGRRLLVPLHELERWIEHEMAIPLVAELSTSTSQRAFVEGRGAE